MFTLKSCGKTSEFEGSICFNRDGSTTQALLLMIVHQQLDVQSDQPIEAGKI